MKQSLIERTLRMNKQTPILYGLLALAIGVVFFLIYQRHKSSVEVDSGDSVNSTSEALQDQPKLEISPDESSQEGTSEEPEKSEPRVAKPRIPDVPVSEADMTPLLRSEVADKWIKEMGYSQAEILAAQKEIRAQGYPEKSVNDPGIVMRHLPSRHMGSVSIKEINVPTTAKAGEPIPFSVRGTAPSPSFNFTHFDVLVQGQVIRIRARGNSDSDTELGPGGSFAESGNIDPLPPGTYNVEIPELGPMGSHQIVVSE